MRNGTPHTNFPWVVLAVMLAVFGPAEAAFPSAPIVTRVAAPASPSSLPQTATKKQIVTVWFNAGVGSALKATEANVQDFQKDQGTYPIEMTLVPEGTHTDRVLAPGHSGGLPCLLFLDGPMASSLRNAMTQAKDAVEIPLVEDTPADAELTMNDLKMHSMVNIR